LVRAFDEAGIPDGVVNFVPGSGSTVGDEFVTSEGTDVVSFTGSYAVGKHVQRDAAEMGKRVQCEMGGKNPLVVDASADLDRAVDLTIAGGVSGLAGQACTATSRVVVFEEVAEEFTERLVSAVEDLTIGDPLDPETDVGPKASGSNLEKDLEYVEIGDSEGATLLTGGERLDREGHYVSPAIFGDVDPDMRLAQEEVFGPVISVISVEDFDEAVDVANDVEYGLSAGICTNRLDHAEAFIDRAETGVVKVNQTTGGVEMQMPFGGRKHSSSETYKEQGRQAIDFYSHEKAVYVTR
jgi:aldehyde dehydrogenase (NAD+)